MDLLILVAIAAAFGVFCWKFVWPGMRDSFRQLAASERKLGPKKFWPLMIGALVWIVLFVWLQLAAKWPGQCDHSGRKLIGFVKELYCSPDLLRGGAMEYALFLILWSAPAMALAGLTAASIRKARGTKFSLYSDAE